MDSLALGHWHSVLVASGERAWYSGAHEATKFGEPEWVHALLVTIPAAADLPVGTPLNTGTLTWGDADVDLSAESADAIRRRSREWPDAGRSLLRLSVCRQITAETADTVQWSRKILSTRFLAHTCDDRHLRPSDVETALADLAGLPHVVLAARGIQAVGTSGTNDGRGAVVARALELPDDAVWTASRA